jgi:hypothetical protein
MKKITTTVSILLVVALIAHFTLIFTVPSYQQFVRDLGRSSGAVLTQDIAQKKYLEDIIDSIPELRTKTSVTFGESSALVINMNIELSDLVAFKDSMRTIRSHLESEFGSDTRPFMIHTINHQFQIPETEGTNAELQATTTRQSQKL